MIDIQTYRARIGSAPGMMSKILQRKATKFKLQESETHHENEDLLRKNLKTVTIPQLSYLLLISLLIFIHLWKPSALLQQFQFEKDTFRGLSPHDCTTFENTCNEIETLTDGLFAIVCTGLCLRSIGAVHFISILLLIAGIEPNPGPDSPKDSETRTKEDPKVDTEVQNDTLQSTNSSQSTQFAHNPRPRRIRLRHVDENNYPKGI